MVGVRRPSSGRPLWFLATDYCCLVADARVYIDGFSLYYGRIRGTEYRWLDLCQLADFLLRNDNVIEVRYYTALDPRPDAAARQQAFLGALSVHDPRLTVFEVDPFDPVAALGSDLLANAERVGLKEVALVVSDDARLTPAVGRCWPVFKHSCGIATPSGTFNAQLVAGAGFRKRVRRSMLITLPDQVGSYQRPAGW
jgi:hypothetical protein